MVNGWYENSDSTTLSIPFFAIVEFTSSIQANKQNEDTQNELITVDSSYTLHSFVTALSTEPDSAATRLHSSALPLTFFKTS